MLLALFNDNQSLATALVSSSLLLAAVLLTRIVSKRAIKSAFPNPDLRRRWLVHTRNALLGLLVIGLIFIWGPELRTLAFSVVAIAVAFVVATKELILCVTGSILKTGAHSFRVGDRIQIKELRGDVIDQNLLATTIMEVGPGKLTHQRTGRVTVIPNSLFVSEPVINESFTDDYALHVFTVPFKRDEDWQAAQQVFLEAARRHAAPYLDHARRHMQRIGDQQGLDTPSVEPRVTIQVPAAGEIHLVVRLPVPLARRGHIEQAILTDCFTHHTFIRKEPAPAAAETAAAQQAD